MFILEDWMAVGGLFFLMVSVFYDVRYYRIPNALTLAGMAAGWIYQLYRAGPSGMFLAMKESSIIFIILFLFYCVHGLGAGDVKLLSALAIFLGLQISLKIIFYSLLIGAFLGLILRKQKIPFSPAILLAYIFYYIQQEVGI